MKCSGPICAGGAMLGFGSHAVASYNDGMMAALIGVPLMTAAIVLYGVLALFRRLHRVVFIIASIAFVPFVFGGLTMGEDAMRSLKRSPGIGWLYFGLFGLAMILFGIVVWRYTSHRARAPAEDSRGS